MINLNAGPPQPHPIAVETNPTTFLSTGDVLAGSKTLDGVDDPGIFSPGDTIYIHNLDGTFQYAVISQVGVASLVLDAPLSTTVHRGASISKAESVLIITPTPVQVGVVSDLGVVTTNTTLTSPPLGGTITDNIPSGTSVIGVSGVCQNFPFATCPAVIVKGVQSGQTYINGVVGSTPQQFVPNPIDTQITVQWVSGGVSILVQALTTTTPISGSISITPLIALPTNAAGVAAIGVEQAFRKATYIVDSGPQPTGVLTANTDKVLLSMDHSFASTKTVRIKKITVSGFINTAGAAAGSFLWRLARGTAQASAGVVLTPILNNARVPAAEVTCRVLPTIGSLGSQFGHHYNWAPAAAGPFTNAIPQVLYQWIPGETEELVLRAGIVEALVVIIDAASTPNISFALIIEFTEE